MKNKENNPNKNNSMFLYTALIFAVALVLIILAFFGQHNLSNLRRSADEAMSALPEPTRSASEPQNDSELAKMVNTISGLTAENKDLKDKINIYDSLLAANGYISVGNLDKAKEITASINASSLTNDQKILYDNILKTINEGKE